MIVGNLIAKFDLDAKGFAAGMKEVQSMTASVAPKVASFSRRATILGGVITAVGTAALVTGLKLSRMVAEIEGIDRKLRFATGSIEKGAKAFAFLEKTSIELGISLEVATHNFGSMAAAVKGTVLEGEGVERIFKAIAKASVVLGLDNQRTALSFLAVQQMMSKGVITQEELRRQLGENLPGALQIMARALGVSSAELNKMVATGALLAENVLPLFAAQIEKEMGPAVKELGNSMAVALGKMSTSWFQLKKAMSEGFIKDTLISFVDLLGGVVSVGAGAIETLNKLTGYFKDRQALYDDRVFKFGKKQVEDAKEQQNSILKIAEISSEKRIAIETKTLDTISSFKNKFATLSEDLDLRASIAGADAYETSRKKILATQEQQIKEIVAFSDTQLSQLAEFGDAQVAVVKATDALILKVKETSGLEVAALNKVLLASIEKDFQTEFGSLLSLTKSVMSDFSSFMVDFAMGTKVSFKEMIDSMLRKILEFTTQLLVIEPILLSFQSYLRNIFKGEGAAGGIGGLLSGLFGALSGGKLFAKGGMITEPVIGFGTQSKTGYMLGESGPEAVIPADLLTAGGGGSQPPVNITINALDSKSLTELMRENPQAVTAPIIASLSSGDRALSSSIRLAVN